MKKVAIFISGRIKYIFNNVYFKKYCKNPNVRFFFCINDTSLDKVELDHFKENISKNIILDDIELQISIINFKSENIPIDHFKLFKLSNSWANTCNVCSMFYSHWLNYKNICSYSVKHNIDFTHVMYMRSDVYYMNDFDIMEQQSEIMIPSGNDYGGINDQFCFMSSECARIYCDVYNNIYKYVSTGECIFHPETLLKNHLKNNNIEDKILRFHLPYFIIR